MDGFVDVLVGNLSAVAAGANNLIVYAGGRQGGKPRDSRAVDATFTRFLNNVTNWLENPDYFTQNAPRTSTEIIRPQLTCEVYQVIVPDPIAERPGASIEERVRCFVWDRVVARIESRDYNSFGDAYWFSQLFTVTDGLINPDVILGSLEAIVIEAILERIFGTKVLGAILSRGCTGNFVYDSQTNIPCGNSRVIGDVVIWQTANTGTATGFGDWRHLTTGEKQLAISQGLVIKGVDKVRVHNRGFRILGIPGLVISSEVMSPNGHIYVGQFSFLTWSEDYAPSGTAIASRINDQATLIHELVHVWQNRNRGCVMVCMIVKAGLARIPPGNAYVYGPTLSAQLLLPMAQRQPYTEYNIEQQAEMVSDRFRIDMNGGAGMARDSRNGNISYAELHSTIVLVP